MEIDTAQRSEAAMAYFRQGYNCCQSVILAFADIAAARAGLSVQQLAAIGSGFGGGIGRMREVCGTVTGLTILSGIVAPALPAPHAAGQDHESAAAMETRKTNYDLVQQLAGIFREENGSIICRELLGLRAGTVSSPQPSERTPQYYKGRPCEQLVGCSARIFAEWLKEERIS